MPKKENTNTTRGKTSLGIKGRRDMVRQKTSRSPLGSTHVPDWLFTNLSSGQRKEKKGRPRKPAKKLASIFILEGGRRSIKEESL